MVSLGLSGVLMGGSKWGLNNEVLMEGSKWGLSSGVLMKGSKWVIRVVLV